MDRKGQWQLSPAYDMTFAFNPRGKWTSKHQMRVNGKQENITLDDLLECAGHMGIRKRPAMEIISEVRAGVSMCGY
jgi:serine/threonine-protein kinase HipA